MKNIFEVNDTDKELLENYQETIPVQTSKEFLKSTATELQRSEWNDEEDEWEFEDLEELRITSLYDFTKTFDENFEDGSEYKWTLICIEKNGLMEVRESYNLITPQSKFIFNASKAEEYGQFEFAIVDYDSIFGTRFTSFMKYNSNFFSCDERVMFEAMLIKFKAFKYKPFYWSKNEMFKEAGIKKDRATKIIKRFEELGIITSELVKTVLGNRPMQITYYNIVSEKVIELLPQIFEGRDDNCNMNLEIKKYLSPSIKESITNKLQ